MKIVGVIASPHEEGNGATLVREALRAAAEAGAEVGEVFLARNSIEFCRACGTCLRTGACAIQDDFQEVRDRLASADGVILSTPAYAAAPSARLKNLFDRLGQLAFLTSFFGGKYMAAIVTASRSTKPAMKQLKGAAGGSIFRRTRFSGGLEVSLKGRHVRDIPEAISKARELGARLARDIASQRPYVLQNLRTRVVNSLITRPLLRRAVVDNRENGFQGAYAELVRKGWLEPAQ
jgi:multimeric flavodoxin WrbA